jgi:hypothetical protein
MSRSDGMTNILWLQGASCGSCTMSILESGASGWFDELRQFGINLLWHPSVSEETGEEAVEVLQSVLDGKVCRHPSTPLRKNIPLTEIRKRRMCRPSRLTREGRSRVVLFASRACGGRGSVGRERPRAGRIALREPKASRQTSDAARFVSSSG